MVQACLYFFLRVKKIQHYAGFTDKGPNKAERVIRTVRKLIKSQYSKKEMLTD